MGCWLIFFKFFLPPKFSIGHYWKRKVGNQNVSFSCLIRSGKLTKHAATVRKWPLPCAISLSDLSPVFNRGPFLPDTDPQVGSLFEVSPHCRTSKSAPGEYRWRWRHRDTAQIRNNRGRTTVLHKDIGPFESNIVRHVTGSAWSTDKNECCPCSKSRSNKAWSPWWGCSWRSPQSEKMFSKCT